MLEEKLFFNERENEMKEIKVLKTEIQIGDQKIMLSTDEMKELKRVLLEALPELYPQHVPCYPYCPCQPIIPSDPIYVIDTWGTRIDENANCITYSN